MKRTKLLLLFVVAFAVSFAGCTISFKPGGESSQTLSAAASKTEKVTEPPESTTSAREEVLVSVDYATDEVLSGYGSFTEFVEDEGEIAQKIVFTTNVEAKGFKYIEVGYRDDGVNIVFFENKVLFSPGELSPKKPFAATWMERGAIPHRGISFIDETDTARYFYIAMSGEDGSLLLVEFENEW